MRRLYKTPGQYLTLGQVVELNRRLLEGYVHFKDEPRVEKLRADVLKYNRRVRDLGLRDHQVSKTYQCYCRCKAHSFPGSEGAKSWLENTWPSNVSYMSLTLLDNTCSSGYDPQFPYSYLGLYHFEEESQRFAFVFLKSQQILTDTNSDALAASVVKIAGRDVLATWKILIAMGVTPVLYTCYAIIATLIAIRAKAPLKWRIWTPVLVAVSLPFMNYAALKFGEAGMDVLK